MSLHYILDGYNIIKQLPNKDKRKVNSSRDSLSYFIKRHRPQGSRKNKVTIVFDGREDVFSNEAKTPIEIIFSKGESADDKIKKMVERSKNPKQVVVVTDDREIRFFVRYLGAKLMTVDEFLSTAKDKSKETQKNEEKKHIPFDVESSITDELKKIWLKK